MIKEQIFPLNSHIKLPRLWDIKANLMNKGTETAPTFRKQNRWRYPWNRGSGEKLSKVAQKGDVILLMFLQLEVFLSSHFGRLPPESPSIPGSVADHGIFG